jgi:hypothetical protein
MLWYKVIILLAAYQLFCYIKPARISTELPDILKKFFATLSRLTSDIAEWITNASAV